MTRLRLTSIRRVLGWTVVICLPGWAVIGVLTALGRLTGGEALLSGGVIWALTVALCFTLLSDFEALIRHAEALVDDPTLPPPRLERSEAARRLAAALGSLRRSWAERRDAAEALARSRKHILDSLPDPVLLLDDTRHVVGTNRAADELLGRRSTGGDLAAVIRDPRVLEAADKVLAGAAAGEAQFTLPAPVERTFGAHIAPLPDTASDGPAVVVQLHDLTDRIKMDRMRADFVANASHELRTPLASLLGFVETLRGPARDDAEARDEFLQIMLKQATRMTRLIDDLLSLSRVELKEHARPTGQVDVVRVVRNTCELLNGQAQLRDIELQLNVDGDTPEIRGDADELAQVFNNLIVNAIKYGDEGEPVEITVKHVAKADVGAGPWVTVTVRDHGDGIPREHIPRLTERFYRVDTARSRELGGTGLGLAIVKHITKRHRGHMTIDSVLHEGSTFTIYLPLAAKTASAPTTPQKIAGAA